GHGIGMSQWGARGMAERGQKYDKILTHFYNGTRLGSM
ncbi:MAG: stage II sporulation protein D, partial [Cyanobacteria bacterium P01_B01_bin.77]